MIKEVMMPFDEVREKYKVGSTVEIDGKRFKVIKVLNALPATCFGSFPRVVFEEVN